MRRPGRRSLAGGAAGIAAGVIGGIVVTTLSAAAAPDERPRAIAEAGHVPPALTLPGEPVTLRFALVCAPRDDGAPCDGSGEVYVRAGQAGRFETFSLTRGPDAKEGRYFVDLPERIAAMPWGFSYYAVLRDRATGATVTVPSGGAAAPQRSLPLRQRVDVDLGAHTFGSTRDADARVVEARWGSALGKVGLAGSRELGFVGPSSFDVSSDGTVVLLDEVNGRVERWDAGRTEAIPVSVSGGLADLAVEPDGTIDVLEPPNRELPTPQLRSFERDGTPRWTQPLADRTWSALASGPDGPVVEQQPSEQWLPVAARGRALGRAEQARGGRSGRPLGNGREVVVDRVGSSELRLAETAGDVVLRSWRVTSATPLGEVQLAEPLGSGVVVVMKTYTDERAEYLVLLLDRTGVGQRFSVAPSEWAESAPLARFRFAGRSLFQLGTTPTAAFVDRFDLEVSP
jgi:hypothetical protein